MSLCFCIPTNAQSLKLDSVRADVIRNMKTDLIISGMVNRFRAEDSVKAFLLSADKNLKKKWTLELSEGSWSSIKDHHVVGDRIIATLVGGHREYGDGLSIYFLVVDGNGKVKRKIQVGRTTDKASNLAVHNNKAYFIYGNSNSIYEHMRTSDTTIFAEVDLENGTINKKYCLCGPFSYPTLIKTKESFLAIGEFYRDRKPGNGFLAMEVFPDSVIHRVISADPRFISTDRSYSSQRFFSQDNRVWMMSVHNRSSLSAIGMNNLSFSVLDSGQFKIVRTAPYSDYNISEMTYLGADAKGVWLFVKDSIGGKNYIRQYSKGNLLFEKEYFSPVTWYNTTVWKVGSEFYATLYHYYEKRSELKKMPLPPLKKYAVTIKLTDENGKPAAGAAIETFNSTSVWRVRYSADKKGYLRLNLTENDFDKDGHLMISFYYKDYPVNNRMLEKGDIPSTLKYRLSRKVDDDPGDDIKIDIDN